MQLKMGRARVSRAADGVATAASSHYFVLTLWWGRFVPLSLRRNAANHTPEAYATHSVVLATENFTA